MYQQAGKAKNPELVAQLQRMEIEDPEQFLDHLENFSNECHACLYVLMFWLCDIMLATMFMCSIDRCSLDSRLYYTLYIIDNDLVTWSGLVTRT